MLEFLLLPFFVSIHPCFIFIWSYFHIFRLSLSSPSLAHLSLFLCSSIKQPNYRDDALWPVPAHLPSGPSPPTQTHRRHTTPLPPAILAHSSLPKSQRGFLCSCPSAVTFPFDFCGQIYRAATVVCQNCVSHLIYVGGFLSGRLSPHRADL